VDDDDWSEVLRWGPLLVNKMWPGADDLYRSLLDSARHHAHVALADFTKDGNEMAISALHAGIAVEHLAKCYLAMQHPMLLADKSCDVDTILHLTGKSELAKTPPYNIKTLGAVEACKRVRYLLAEFRFNEQVDGFLFDVRNSVGHLGIAVDVRKAIRAMVRLAGPLLSAIGYDRVSFWGNKLQAVDALYDETISELEAILQAKYEAARNTLASALAGLDASQQAAFKAIMVAKGIHSTSDYAEPYPCPVCQAQGWLICTREYDFVDDEANPKSYSLVFIESVAYPLLFECGVCRLELDESEMEAAGMPAEIELPDSEVGKHK
jgi:hypothetical protein